MIRLRSLPVVCALLLATAGSARTLSAQAAPTATGPGKSFAVGAGASLYHLDYGDRWLGAPMVFADANLWWRVGLEGEARWLRYNQDLGTHTSTFLVGPRYSFSPRRTEPYVKALVGLGEYTYPFNYAKANYTVIAGGGGVDYHLTNRVQIRVVDVEYQRWLNATFNNTTQYGVSSGISFALFWAREH